MGTVTWTDEYRGGDLLQQGWVRVPERDREGREVWRDPWNVMFSFPEGTTQVRERKIMRDTRGEDWIVIEPADAASVWPYKPPKAAGD